MADTTNSTAATDLATEAEGDPYLVGSAAGQEIALCHVARAWIDRWKAAGGDFGARYNNDGSLNGIVRGVVEPSFWTPTDDANEKLPPHTWLLEKDHQRGAVKVLEAMLLLVPGLDDAVRDIVGPSILANLGREG